MRILLVQMQATSKARPRPRFDPWLAVLASVLRQDGHELSLLSFSRYQSPELHDAICRFRPNGIYVSADRFAADIARHAVQFIGRHHVLPVIIGGMYATAQPDAALSIPGVLAVAVGEPEVSVRRFLWAMEHGEDYEQTPGMWINPAGGSPVKNEPAPLTTDLDLLPLADRDLFDYQPFVNRTHAVELSVGRGCPNRCAHCLNDWLADLYVGRGAWVRRRSPDNICDELDRLCERFPQVERVRFIDHHLAADPEWLERFAEIYADRCGLPFSCHLRIASADSHIVRLLHDAGCEHAFCELVSGSDFIRNEIYQLGSSDRQIERTFRLLKAASVRATAVVMLGSPYETPITVDETLELLDRVQPDLVLTRLFVPSPGTRVEELCRDCGWLSGLGERAFRENVPMLRMPGMPAEKIVRAFDQFNWQARHPRSAWLMRLLDRLPVGRGRSLYDLLVRHPSPNGRLLPTDPRSVEVHETDGAMNP
jgi:anaerobic magnesium-protoporphyrin IX monomethyl ester cyclase